MAGLSMTQAWNEAAEFARRNFGALFTVAAAFLVVPGVVAQTFAPAPGAPGGVLPALLTLVALLLNLAGSLVIAALATGRENVVGAGIKRAFRRLPTLFVAVLLLALAGLLLLVPLVAASGLRPEDLRVPVPAEATMQRVYAMSALFLLVMLPFMARLLVITPVAAGEDLGPVATIRRSWRLTRGSFWKLLGFVLILAAVALIVMLATRSVLGVAVTLLLGPIEPRSLAAVIFFLLSSLVTAAVGVFVTSMVARIYVQLAERATTGT
jgi:hypothetical protein